MKTLIVYYSYMQDNESIAKELQQQLGGADILKIEEMESRTAFTVFLDNLFNRTPNIKENKIPFSIYDNFIFVGPIWAGKIASPIKTFMFQKSNLIKRYSFISVYSELISNQKKKITEQLRKLLKRDPEIVTELTIM